MQQDRIVDLNSTAPDKGANPASRLELTAYVSAKDVQQALGCSMSQAYVHLRRATGKTGRGLLRAPVEVWEAYARRVYGVPAAAVAKTGIVNGGRERGSAVPSAANDDGDRIEVLERRLDEARRLLDELGDAVAQYRCYLFANAGTA